jgi:hypothetical protein
LAVQRTRPQTPIGCNWYFLVQPATGPSVTQIWPFPLDFGNVVLVFIVDGQINAALCKGLKNGVWIIYARGRAEARGHVSAGESVNHSGAPANARSKVAVKKPSGWAK